MAIEIPGGKRNLNMNINAQQAILNAYITNNCCGALYVGQTR